MKYISKGEAIELLKAEQMNADKEGFHERANAILCDLLEALGHADVVLEYYRVRK